MDTKECSKCKQTKALNEFNTRPDRPSGYRSECKKCQYRQHRNRHRPPRIFRAYNKLHYAQKKGLIIKPELCEDCNNKKTLLAHHPNYDNPYDVIWVCHKCHTIAHKQDSAEDRLRRKNVLMAITRRNIAL